MTTTTSTIAGPLMKNIGNNIYTLVTTIGKNSVDASLDNNNNAQCARWLSRTITVYKNTYTRAVSPLTDEGCCNGTPEVNGPTSYTELTTGGGYRQPSTTSVTPTPTDNHQGQQQPRAKTRAYLRPNRANDWSTTRTWTPTTPNGLHPTHTFHRVCFGRRPAVRRKPHKSGRRPRGRRPWHCRRPSVVTEGYIRWPPLPPTHPRFTPGPRLYL